MDWFRFFCRETKPVITGEIDDFSSIAKGQKWVLPSDKSPWPSKFKPVTILDVRDGWVRYAMGSCFSDERKETKEFLSMYKPFAPNVELTGTP